MSSLWTPGGERPVAREPGGPSEPGPGPEHAAPTPQEVEELTRQVASIPARAIIAEQHVMGLYDLAALHLSQQPPNLAEASLAIDAMGALVGGLAARLGEYQPAVDDALAQLRMAFVQIQAGLATPPDGDDSPNSA